MLIKVFVIVALASSVISRNVPRYLDLDEEDQKLFRAAYDAPYEQEEYYEEEEVPGKLDLLKGGLWALKTKMKELKVFDKALAAHLLATKLQLKKLLGTLKKPPIIVEVEKKPIYHYQSPAPSYQHELHYEPPHYPVPPEHYSAPAPPHYPIPAPPEHYSAPAPPHYPIPAPPEHYSAPAPPHYPIPAPPEHYPAPAQPPVQYQPAPQYSPPPHVPPKYEPPAPPQYPPAHYEVPLAPPVQYNHDPYYGY